MKLLKTGVVAPITDPPSAAKTLVRVLSMEFIPAFM
jgi:hypothetical protein